MPFARRLLFIAASAIFGVSLASKAMAGQPVPWQLGMQDAATQVMSRLSGFHDFVTILSVAITVFVLALILYIALRFNAKANPVSSNTTHNKYLEVLWTLIPTLILVAMAIPSFRLMYYMDRVENAEITIKAIGHQWYWSYVYPDHDDLTFDAFVLEDDELEEGQPRLLATDTAVVVPVNKTVRVLVTSTDVLHAWAIPAFGAKIDAIPGRLNETWFHAEREGTYYGQCSELCGTNHAMMPITVKVVSDEAYAAWLKEAKEEYATNNDVNREMRIALTEVQK